METENKEWAYSSEDDRICRILETQRLWGQTICLVWFPDTNKVKRLLKSTLHPLEHRQSSSVDHILYVAAAARVAEALTRDVLLAPIEASVIPLPHQLRVLSRAIANDKVRYLLADEVGLGKTIEAGLIMRELKLRGLVERTLVVAPRGLVNQWVSEMRVHFSEKFRLLIPGEFSSYRAILHEENIWHSYPQIVTPVDSIKPIEKRKGWSEEKVDEINLERFENLISAGWDLIIVDEAHRLGGSTEQVARYKLGRGLSEAAPYFLLLSATPHQGKRDSFHRLISLLDEEAFPDEESVTRDCVRPYMIRMEKRKAIDASGEPLFKPRITELVPITWEAKHREQQLLYEAVTEYVREGYNQALREKRTHIGFLMLLLQRLVVSSTRAIRTSLEKRLEALLLPQEQLPLFPMISEEDWADLDGQDQMDTLLRHRLKALKNEQDEVRLLIEAAKRCEAVSPDAKAEALLSWIYQLQAEQGDPALKILIFTEFIPTQTMLFEFLSQRGFEVVCLNGSMDMEARIQAQNTFAQKARIMVSTEAGGEGLNLQFCHVVINYDLPWNPMRIEQRIGRVDRIGQDHSVRAINFILEGTVEHRVRTVLEEKLLVIFEQLGIDKTGDVLDSAQAGLIFEDLYRETILNPDNIEEATEKLLRDFHRMGEELQANAEILGSVEDPDPAIAQEVMNHPIQHWTERMTVHYIRSKSGEAQRKGRAWEITWPDGKHVKGVVFTSKDAEENPVATYLSLEDPRVRSLVSKIPPFTPGQSIPLISGLDLALGVIGTWSLWRIAVSAADWEQYRIMPLFITDDEQVLLPTARYIWDQLLQTSPAISMDLDHQEDHQIFDASYREAIIQGQQQYGELSKQYLDRLDRERKKGEFALESRKKAIRRIGLSTVRHYRLRALRVEEEAFKEEMEHRSTFLPEMTPLLMIRVEAESNVQP